MNTHTTISSQLQILEELAAKAFNIEISPQKMLENPAYFNLVLTELYALEHQEIKAVIETIRTITTKDKVETPSTALTLKKPFYSQPMTYIALTLSVMLIACFIYFTQSPTTPANDVPVSKSEAIETITPPDSTIVTIATPPPLTLPVKNPEVVFRLHGSNTIGEKLAPALVESYLKNQGIETLYWQQGEHSVEKTLQYIKNNKPYAIELHAHGSSTAFKDLQNGTADIGMASRKIKQQEAEKLNTSLGDLSKVGNEHIIGLDGLAVIVNQNNPIKEVSAETLAKIFAGEITHWNQLGGPKKIIKLYARDKNSGTWDTFKNLVLKKFNRKLSPDATRLESSSVLTTKVSQDEAAIGFIGLNYIAHNKALAISAGKNTKPIFPTRFTISTEDYALSRRLYFYTPTNAAPVIKDFAQYAISQIGQDIVEETGLISQNIKVETVYPIVGAPEKYNNYVKQAKRLSLNFRFEYRNKDLDNKGKRDLIRLVDFMEANVGRRIVLMGFSDSIGEINKNLLLSLKRAKSVERELTARGIPVLAVEGLGEMLPIANNNTEIGRERNRRVEVWIL